MISPAMNLAAFTFQSGSIQIKHKVIYSS